MRAIPGMIVFDPADAIELRAMLKYLAETPGPAYMRVPRGKVPVIFDEADYHFEAGKAAMLRDGKDAAIISSGILLPEAIQAAENLAAKGVQVCVLNMGSIKPIDEQAILAAARDTGCIVTAENHSSYGGLGGAVAEIVSQNYPVPMKILGIENRFGEVGPNDWLLARFGLNAEAIEKAVIETMEKKG
jgi:transketolase